MKAIQFALSGEPSAVAQSDAVRLGFACAIMRASPHHARLPISYIERIIEPAIKHRLLKFYFDEDGRPVGYVIWASLAADVEMRFLKQGSWNLHPSEWKEGDSVWIVDFAAPRGHAASIARDLRQIVFAGLPRLRYCRTRGERTSLRELERRDDQPFLSFEQCAR
jgi:hemolysin-activating ACP:hemolysin acyltransferase